MAEDKKKFVRRIEAFDEGFDAGDWNKAIELSEALRAEFPDTFNADEVNTRNLLATCNNRGVS